MCVRAVLPYTQDTLNVHTINTKRLELDGLSCDNCVKINIKWGIREMVFLIKPINVDGMKNPAQKRTGFQVYLYFLKLQMVIRLSTEMFLPNPFSNLTVFHDPWQ